MRKRKSKHKPANLQIADVPENSFITRMLSWIWAIVSGIFLD